MKFNIGELMINKKTLRYMALSALLATSNAYSLNHESSSMDVIHFMYSLNVNEIPDEELNKIKRILNSEGPLEFKDATTGRLIPTLPGTMSAQEGLRFIPDEELYVDTYVSLVEHGALPFAAVMLVYDEYESVQSKGHHVK